MAEQELCRTVTEKLDVIRLAAQLAFPTADIDTMLAEIENGYGTDSPIPSISRIEPCDH